MIPTTTIQVWLIAAIFLVPVVLTYDFVQLRAVALSKKILLDSAEWRTSIWSVFSARATAMIFSCVLAGLLPLLPLIVFDYFGKSIRKISFSIEYFLEAMVGSDCFNSYTARSPDEIGQLIFDVLALVAVALLLYWISAWLMKVILSLFYRAETGFLIHPCPAQIRVGAAIHASTSLLVTVFFR